MFAEFKGQQGFEYTYGGLLWFCMNRLPKFGGDDGQWVYDRIMVVECPNVIPKDMQDKTLLDKMYAEREGIGLDEKHAKGTIRISLGKNNTADDVNAIAATLIKILK